MRARRGTARWGAVAALVAGALVAGCGVPTHTDVAVQGQATDEGPSGAGDQPREPPGPGDADNPQELVDNFLQAAARDPDNATEVLRAFLHPDRADTWEPEPQVMVVRVAGNPVTTRAGPDRTRVGLDVRWVGTLNNGVVEPRAATSQEYEFEVATVTAGRADNDVGVEPGDIRYRIVAAPDVIMLEDQALADRNGYLLPSPVYYWDNDAQVLVPDLRWLPTALSVAQRVQAKLEWLVSGPAPWLESLTPLPSDVDLDGNVVPGEDRLDVALTPAAAEMHPGRLNAQLWWTLQDELQGGHEVWLTIDGQERAVTADEDANPTTADAPPSFVVLDGEIVPYEPSGGEDMPVLADGFGVEVSRAAVPRGGRDAALVHPDPADGRDRLRLVDASGAARTALARDSIGRPLWLGHPGGTGLVTADGALYRFGTGEGSAQEVTVPGVAGSITAVAVAPDGRRAALVADGELYVAALVRRDDGAVSVNRLRLLPTTATDLDGVAFVEENRLAVIGQDGDRRLLFGLTVDGAYESRMTNGEIGAPQTVTNVVGYPGDPLQSSPRSARGAVMWEQDGIAYVYRDGFDPVQISAADLGVEGGPAARAPFFAE